MQFLVVTGSHRPESQLGKIGCYIEHLVAEHHPAVETTLLDLGRTPMPLWNESLWTEAPLGFDRWLPISKSLEQCDALVVVAPE